MRNVVEIEQEQPEKKSGSRKFSYYLEDHKAQFLLSSTDNRGKKAYFFKMHITGLQERIFGPYDSRSMAVECFDRVLERALESFFDCHTCGNRSASNSGMEHIALPTDLTPIPMK
jgi:hypothetical protein